MWSSMPTMRGASLLAEQRAGDVRGRPPVAAHVDEVHVVARVGRRRLAHRRCPRSSASCGAFTNDTGSSTTGPSTPFSTDEREHAAVVVGDLAFVARSRACRRAPPASAGEQPPEPLGERQERPHRLGRLGRGDVDGERHEVAAQREHDLLGDRLARLVLRLGRRRAEVRRDDDVVELEQRRLGGRLRARTRRSRRRRCGPSRIASASASSSTMPPRPALTSRSAGLACASTLGVDEPDRLGRLR